MNSTTSHHHYSQQAPPPEPPQTCAQGHRTTLIIPTEEGGSICLLCFSNLISNPKSPTVHVSYALSQLSIALSQPQFRHAFFTFHSHFLISPLVGVFSSFDDDPIALQTVELIVQICEAADSEVSQEFVARVSDRLSSGSLAWSRRQHYTLHCLGVLLNSQKSEAGTSIKDVDALIYNLVNGLQLSSEEVQAEILFVLYKIFLLLHSYNDNNCTDSIFFHCPKLVHLSLEVLMKAENDDLRLNCLALLTVLAQKGLFQITLINDARRSISSDVNNLMQTAEDTMDNPPLVLLFAEAVKGPLLSSDSQVQVATLDLLFLFLSGEDVSGKEIEVFVEQNIADYVFEILRLSVDSSQTKGCKDSLISACIQVLDLLSTVEKTFVQRLATGLTTLVPVLHYSADVPFHPVQTETLKLVWTCVTNWPGIVSKSHIEEISFILSGMLKKNIDGEAGMSPTTFSLVCSVLVALMKCSCSNGISSFLISIQDASRNSVLTCLGHYVKHPSQILHSLYLLKETYLYSYGENLKSICTELRGGIIEICRTHIIPWFVKALNDIEEEDIALAVFETFHTILLQDSGTETKLFANILVSFSWFSFSFGSLGLFPTEKMKWRVYLLFSSLSQALIGDDSGQCISDAALHLPSDPVDLLFLLGQRSYQNHELSCCQSAVLMLLHISSLHDDRIADDKLVLASLEQYIMLNSNEYLYGPSGMLELLVNLYALYRALAKMSYQIAYSLEAEKIMFHLLAEKDWDLLTTRIHLTSLKWLFQQERICKLLSLQILKFCRYNLKGQQMAIHCKDNQKIDVRAVADLITSGDNFAGLLFVIVLGELVDEDDKEIDIGLVLRTIQDVIEISPAASDQLCLHGIGSAFLKLFYQSRYSSCPDIFTATSELAFRILQIAKSESISDDDHWVGIVVKLMDYLIPSVAADGWSREALVVVGIFSVILHHSINQKLIEASKSILMSTPLMSMLNDTITEACSKGPALIDHDETTTIGEVLIFVLALLFLAFRSAYAILPEIVDCQHLLDESRSKQPLPYISIKCQDLCKLIHFGSSIVKLAASYHLVEIFSRISEANARKPDEFKFERGYLSSAIAVLEGLIFSNDIQVSMNCSLCLSMILGWQDLRKQVPAIERDSWFRLIVEDLALSLAVPCLASKSFTIYHKPAIHVAVSLLRMKQPPPWITSVFDEACICGIIKNISISNLSSELVLLFRELLNCGYLKGEQFSSLNRIFQECRRCIYRDKIQDVAENNVATAILGDLRKSCEFLINLMKSQSSISVESSGSQSENRRLLEEIELFSKCLMVDD